MLMLLLMLLLMRKLMLLMVRASRKSYVCVCVVVVVGYALVGRGAHGFASEGQRMCQWLGVLAAGCVLVALSLSLPQ
jgi:hypothetical protein